MASCSPGGEASASPFLRACIPTTICVSGIFRCSGATKKSHDIYVPEKKRQEAVSQKRMDSLAQLLLTPQLL